jgi:glycosyltransferase involved in cell wall biosynthesis
VNLTPRGFGDKVAWEAMSCTCPCLVANDDFRETLGEYAEALLFCHQDSEQLSLRLQQILELSGQERAQIGWYLRQQVIKLHSLDRLASKIVEVIQMYKQ